jgi:hypothetical protein
MTPALEWAFRILSPEWRDIWEISDDYPAEYHGVTEKKVIVTAGSQSSAATTHKYIRAVCKAMQEKGIQIYMVYEGKTASDNSADALSMYQTCTQSDIYPERLNGLSSYGDMSEAIKKMAQRQYHVRLSS